MPWKISGFEEKHWYQSPLPWLGVTAAIGLLFLVLPRAQTLYRQWREHYRLQRAETAFGHGDFRRAMINAQMLLAKNPRSVEGLRVADLLTGQRLIGDTFARFVLGDHPGDIGADPVDLP